MMIETEDGPLSFAHFLVLNGEDGEPKHRFQVSEVSAPIKIFMYKREFYTYAASLIDADKKEIRHFYNYGL